MGKRPKYTGAPRKAKMIRGDGQGGELAQAMHIWKNVLLLDQHKFDQQQHMDEKRISMETWEGCTSYEYDEHTPKYRYWNDKVINYWHSIDERCRITRIYDQFKGKPRHGEWESRICRSDKRHSIDRLKRKTNIGAGMIASAIQDNERYDLKQNVGQLFAKSAFERIQALPGIPEEKKLALAAEAAFQQALVAGEKTGQQNIIQGVLGVLDNKPALKAIDDQSTDDYSEQAKQRRQENENR